MEKGLRGVGQFGEEGVEELADTVLEGSDGLREGLHLAGEFGQALALGVGAWGGVMVGGEEEGDGPSIDSVSLGEAEGEGGGESLDTQGVDEEGSQAHLAEVAHQEGGVGAAGLDGDAAGGVEQEGEPPQVLTAEGEGVGGEAAILRGEDGQGEGVLAHVNTYQLLRDHFQPPFR